MEPRSGESPSRREPGLDHDPEDKTRLRKGDHVELERGSGDWMKGVVVGLAPDGIEVVVDGPILEGETLSVSRTVRDDARYTAAMKVIEAAPGRSRIRLTGEWRRVQMRDHVRVSVLGLSVEIQAEGKGKCTAKLVDLSAGGLRFASEERYGMGATLKMRFGLPQTGPVSVRGEIVRMAEGRRGAPKPCEYGVRFVGLSETARVKLMTWVFAEQARRFREKPEAG